MTTERDANGHITPNDIKVREGETCQKLIYMRTGLGPMPRFFQHYANTLHLIGFRLEGSYPVIRSFNEINCIWSHFGKITARPQRNLASF
jgi:hypothetical protein